MKQPIIAITVLLAAALVLPNPARGVSKKLWETCKDEHYKLEYAEIHKACTKIIKSRPKSADRARAYMHRGEAAMRSKKKDHKRLIADFNRAIELAPNNARGYSARGYYYSTWADERSRNLVQAVSDFSRSLELEPTSYYVLWWRGEALKDLKLYDRALVDLTRAMPHHSYHSFHSNSIKLDMAETYLGKGEADTAISFAEHVMSAEQSKHYLPRAFLLRGRAYLAKKAYGLARADLEKVSLLSLKFFKKHGKSVMRKLELAEKEAAPTPGTAVQELELEKLD